MAETLRIAAAQSEVTCDPVANGRDIRRLMALAAGQGTRLIHFPEGAASGYPGGAESKAALAGWNIDWTGLRRELQLTADLARELRLWVVLGAAHALTPPHRPHNSLYVISDTGALVGRYDKRLLSYNEDSGWYTPGAQPLVFEVDGFRFGCALCIEIQFPEVFLEYNALGVDCVIFSSFSEDPIFDVIARGYAAATNMWFSVSVPAACSVAMAAGVIGPHGYRLGSCPSDALSGIVCVDLDRHDPALDIALTKARPWRATARARTLHRPARVADPRSVDTLSF